MSLASFDSLQDSFFNSKHGDSVDGSTKQYGSRFKDIKYSFAYETGLMKERCGLCKMYFHKSTVCYSVPNHRILELQKKWKFDKSGRRFQSASYLYNMTEVCLFCSQLFSIIPGEEKQLLDSTPGGRDDLKITEEEYRLEIKTKLERTDVAQGQRSYQSSEVDNKGAALAVTAPYTKTTKTRREADPWWEVDLGRPFHIHSLTFQISTAIRQKLFASIFVLSKPLGFEDPFLDSVQQQALIKKEFLVQESDKIRMENISWELPPNTRCAAVRIQLRGVNYLALQRFQAWQGDDMVVVNEADYQQTADSYASLGPQQLRESMLEMMSPERKKAQIMRFSSPAKERLDFHNYDLSSVNLLSTNIKHRYGTIDTWRNRVLHYAQMFPQEELLTLHRIVFKYVCDMNFGNKDHPPLADYDFLNSALIQHYPRCDLNELHQRMRSVVRWIQTRTHLKVLGALLNSDNFTLVANDPNEHLYHLLSAFKRVQYNWDKKEEVERAAKDKRHGSPTSGKQRSSAVAKVGTSVAESRGCSWSQFLLIMALFCSNQSFRIPELVFNIDDGKVYVPPVAALPTDGTGSPNEGEDKSVGFTFHSGEGKSVSSYSLANTSVDYGGFAGGRNSHWLKSLSAAKINHATSKVEQKSIQDKVRDPLMPVFNSSFAEYKFSKFKKRVSSEQQFPKTLSLDFARSLIPSRAATSHGMTFKADVPAGDAVDVVVEKAVNDDLRSDSSNAQSAHSPPAEKPTRSTLVRMPTMMAGLDGFSRPGTGILTRQGTSGNLLRGQSFSQLNTGQSFSLGNGNPPLSRPSSSAAVGLNRVPSMVSLSGGKAVLSRSLSVKPSSANLQALVSSTVEDEDSEAFSLGTPEKRDDRESDSKAPAIDFFRVCALCERRLPRSAMEIKVFRKHVVKLRSSWDPKLVSKEIRSLDNTISMYNLVDVCLFCSQYFDPDFPDGIAYPVKTTKEVMSSSGAVNAIASQGSSAQYVPFFDTRYMNCDIDVGALFQRPRTVESRQRARRATEIAVAHEKKMASFSSVTDAT